MRCRTFSPTNYGYWVPVVFCIAGLPGLGVPGQNRHAAEKDYVKVEVRGEFNYSVTVLYDQAKTGTSLTPEEMHPYVRANGIIWRLDFRKHPDKRETAFRKLLTKTVIVTGTLSASDLTQSARNGM